MDTTFAVITSTPQSDPGNTLRIKLDLSGAWTMTADSGQSAEQGRFSPAIFEELVKAAFADCASEQNESTAFTRPAVLGFWTISIVLAGTQVFYATGTVQADSSRHLERAEVLLRFALGLSRPVLTSLPHDTDAFSLQMDERRKAQLMKARNQ